jgi:hypothetical protein
MKIGWQTKYSSEIKVEKKCRCLLRGYYEIDIA